MKKITIASENGLYSIIYENDEDEVKQLKEYIEKKKIDSDKRINDAHKLLLDISRNDNVIVNDNNGKKTLYIGEKVTKDQYDMIADLIHGTIISVYDWYNSNNEYNGYHIRELDNEKKTEEFSDKARKKLYKKQSLTLLDRFTKRSIGK